MPRYLRLTVGDDGWISVLPDTESRHINRGGWRCWQQASIWPDRDDWWQTRRRWHRSRSWTHGRTEGDQRCSGSQEDVKDNISDGRVKLLEEQVRGLTQLVKSLEMQLQDLTIENASDDDEQECYAQTETTQIQKQCKDLMDTKGTRPERYDIVGNSAVPLKINQGDYDMGGETASRGKMSQSTQDKNDSASNSMGTVFQGKRDGRQADSKFKGKATLEKVRDCVSETDFENLVSWLSEKKMSFEAFVVESKAKKSHRAAEWLRRVRGICAEF
eukprot:TRINITY_DN30096_c0_g1_i2.p1 TRINITY_DN30096_c0_g1~~TRINITY_DN30096_c0_g1_i2.p1  ORF type:complete len:273 (-),score=55.82 TRINITY_DN30096_c0_g1_i2:322-1140(-)